MAVGGRPALSPPPPPTPASARVHCRSGTTRGRPTPMKGPLPHKRRAPVDDALAVGRRRPGGPVEAGLLDLPDDLLRVVAQLVAKVEDNLYMCKLLPFLLTCRRLAAVGYSSVERLFIDCWGTNVTSRRTFPDPFSDAVLLGSAQGERMARRLSSLCAVLRNVHHVRRVVLDGTVP